MFTVQVSCLLLVDAEVRVLLNFPIPVLLTDFKGPVTALPGSSCHSVEFGALTCLALKEGNRRAVCRLP